MMPYGPRPYLTGERWWAPDIWLEEHPALRETVEQLYERRNITRCGYQIARGNLTTEEEALLRAGAEETP
jgi:hypothetical protein